MIPEWRESYMSYKKLKKILKILSEKFINKPPAEWDIGVSLSTPAPTNAAAMPQVDTEHLENDNQSENSSVVTSEEVHYTQNDFFKQLEADMDTVQAFTKEQVIQIRGALKAVDASLRSFNGEGEPPIGIKEQVDAIGDRFLKLEKYVNLNFTGFRKILKKHDKLLPNPCSSFYIGRLHQQGWVRGDYSDVIVNISSIYSRIRGDVHKEGGDGIGAQDFLRKTTKYWVRPEFVTAIKYLVSQRLPVSLFGGDGDYKERSDAQLVNSVYLDNSQLELYHGRLDKTPGAIALRLRWYGTGEPELVFVERKTHRDSWTGEVSVKERFIISPKEVPLLLSGKFDKAAKIEQMRAKGKSQQEIEDWNSLASEIIQAINSKQLVPTMRSQYMRTAFQIKNDASVRISLDTNLCMIYERDTAVMLGDRWYRDPTKAVPANQITRFPHAVLEIKLEILEGMSTPEWVKEILTSGMVCEVFKFSKFIHGCAVLMQDDVQAVPYWVDDPSLTASIEASKGEQMLSEHKSRIDANKQLPQLLPYGATQMERRPAPKAFLDIVQSGRQQGKSPARDSSKSKSPSSSNGDLMAAGGGGGGGSGTVSELSDLEDNAALFYEQRANDVPNQWCGGTPCWWMGAVSLVADDLPTPAQKVEPKVHFANERTLIHWFHVAVYFTSLSSAILAFAPANSPAEMFAISLLLMASFMIGYAIRTFHIRAAKIRERAQVRWDDPLGPVILGVTLIIAFGAFFFAQLSEILGE